LIIGGSDAGISAALRAREVNPACEITVVAADRYPNYSICGLPFWLGVAALSDIGPSYTPPLSTPWDAVQAAAQAWIEAQRNQWINEGDDCSACSREADHNPRQSLPD